MLSTSGESGANHLVEAQKQQLKAAHRATLMRSHQRSVLDSRVEYSFCSKGPSTEAKDAVTRSLGVYVVGPRPQHKPSLSK
ncbi:hypothetical protein Plhal304r1_c009g0037311 [Plasmopara halstedii]